MSQNEEYLSRPARKQKDKIEAKNSHLEGNQDYNIWYGKHRGENWNEAHMGMDLAPNRCVITTDAGRTKADARDSGQKFFCIQVRDCESRRTSSVITSRRDNIRRFALANNNRSSQFVRGKCARGSECTWFHRVPTVADDGMASQMHDCFGRERHKTHKDDMSGAGSFESPSRTLYVGRLRPDKYDTEGKLHDALKNQVRNEAPLTCSIEVVSLTPCLS